MEISPTAPPVLPIRHMDARHYGLPKCTAEHYLDAARVCLDAHHASPEEFLIANGKQETQIVAVIEWESPDLRCKAAWNNIDDAARDGAYLCALAAVELLFGMYAVSRSETKTGADYYVAPSNNIEDLENCYRVEISGTNSDKYALNRAIKNKVEQARNGNSNLPALAAVVGFRVRSILVQFVEHEP